jgi:hypothetical protein
MKSLAGFERKAQPARKSAAFLDLMRVGGDLGVGRLRDDAR